MDSESSRAERLCFEPPEDRELIVSVEREIFEVGGSGGDDQGRGWCISAVGWRGALDCGGGAVLPGPLGPTEIGWLATAPKDCCDGRKAFEPLT